MSTKIGRQTYFGLGVEAVTRGTKATADDWFMPTSIDVVDITEHVTDNSGIGVLANSITGRKVKKMSEISVEGFLGDRLIGFLLYGALGTVGSATLVETGVYSHAFSESNVNTKPSFTAYVKDTDQAEKALFSMINTLELNFVAGEKAVYKAQFMGQNLTDESSTPSISAENPLDTHDITIEYASIVGSLGGGTEFTVKELNLLIQNNIADYTASGSVVPSAMYNQTLKVSGDFTLIYDSDTYRDFVSGDTWKAMRIHLENTDNLIGATEYPSLTIDMAHVIFTDWKTDRSIDGLVMQTISFEACYDLTASQMIIASLVNAKSTNYS